MPARNNTADEKEFINQFRLRNQQRSQQRTALPPTSVSAVQFDRRQQDLQQATACRRDYSNLPLDSIIELSSITSSDTSNNRGAPVETQQQHRHLQQQQQQQHHHLLSPPPLPPQANTTTKKKPRKQRRQDHDNDNDNGGNNVADERRRNTSCHTSLPTLDDAEQGDTPDELASVASGIVRFPADNSSGSSQSNANK
jgi:hypothetical protein